MRTLIVSEKDIAAGRIAKALSDDRVHQDKVGGVNVYEWTHGKDEFACVGLRGHITSLDYPSEFRRWSLVKLPELVAAVPRKTVDDDAKHIADAIRRLAKDADRVIIATDFDREGELIGVEGLSIITGEGLYEPARKGKKAAKSKKGAAADGEGGTAVAEPKPKARRTPLGVKRARFSALTKEEVRRAFANLTEIDMNLAYSAEARQVVDLAWGAALTRFISLSSGTRGDDFLSVGRVQSPTLAIIVDKEKEIRRFVPEPYWEVHATLAKGASEFDAQHKEGRFRDAARAEDAHRRVAAVSHATVVAVDRSERTEKPPEPFNTTSYLRAATAIGFTAARAMSVAEDLYTKGWISYPRTDNTVYPPSLNLREILEKFDRANGPFAAEARAILAKGELKPTRGKKQSTDHPPITPYEVARGSDLSGDEWKVYELVVRRFLATLSDASVEERLRVTFDAGGEPFYSTGHRMLKPGFRTVYAYHKGEDVVLPPLAEGDRVDVRGVEVASKMTQPPKRYSQGKLIQEMENLGLGTKSTRADIIEKLYRRDYIRNNPPEPTETGFAVTDALERYAELIAKPDMTAALEKEMDEIAEGARALPVVIEDSKGMLMRVLHDLDANRESVGQEIRAALLVKNTVGKCGKSDHALVIRRARTGKRFVGCSGWPECSQTYPLPQAGKVVADGTECPVCAAPVIRVIQAKKRPWVTCLTIGCKGVEEREQREREARKAAKLADAPEPAEGDAETSTAAAEPDPEDLGEAAADDQG